MGKNPLEKISDRSIRSRIKSWFTIDFVANAMLTTSGVALFLLMIIMMLHVVGRKIGHPFPGAFEVSEELMVVIFSFPLAALGLRKQHIIFELLFVKLPLRMQAKLEAMSNFLGALLFGVLAWKGWQIALESTRMGEYRQGLFDFPVWPFRLALAFGLSFFAIQLILSTVQGVRSIRTKNSSTIQTDS